MFFLLDFVYQHNPHLVNKISEPIFENCSDRLILANHSLKQLNVIDDNNYIINNDIINQNKIINKKSEVSQGQKVTIVTGLWDIKRNELTGDWARDFSNHYLEKLN